MKIRYKFPRLSRQEQDFLEAVLMEEIDIQRWYTVTSIQALGGGEVFLAIQ
jgi:hypothetical protein